MVDNIPDVQTETWTCSVCTHPCTISIKHALNDDVDAHTSKKQDGYTDYFVDKHFCICRRTRPNWKKM